MASEYEVVPIPEGNSRGHELGKTAALRALAPGEALRVPVDVGAKALRYRWISVASAAFGKGNFTTSIRDGYLYIWRKDAGK